MAEKGVAPPFLASLGDTAGMIELLREELAAVQKQKADLDVKENDLQTRINAWNTLRQAHGVGPL